MHHQQPEACHHRQEANQGLAVPFPAFPVGREPVQPEHSSVCVRVFSSAAPDSHFPARNSFAVPGHGGCKAPSLCL